MKIVYVGKYFITFYRNLFSSTHKDKELKTIKAATTTTIYCECKEQKYRNMFARNGAPNNGK